MNKKLNVLFLCTGNSCRSQMAEALLRNMDIKGKFEAYSAGLNPAKNIHPLTIKAMNETGIDVSHQQTKGVDTYLGRESIRYIITVCSKAEKYCPRIWPGLPEENRFYWPVEDPAGVSGPEDERLDAFRKARDQLRDKIAEWLKVYNN